MGRGAYVQAQGRSGSGVRESERCRALWARGEGERQWKKRKAIIGAISHSFASVLIFSSSSAVGHSSEPLKEQRQQQRPSAWSTDEMSEKHGGGGGGWIWLFGGHADEALRSFYERRVRPLARLAVALGQYCHA